MIVTLWHIFVYVFVPIVCLVMYESFLYSWSSSGYLTGGHGLSYSFNWRRSLAHNGGTWCAMTLDWWRIHVSKHYVYIWFNSKLHRLIYKSTLSTHLALFVLYLHHIKCNQSISLAIVKISKNRVYIHLVEHFDMLKGIVSTIVHELVHYVLIYAHGMVCM